MLQDIEGEHNCGTQLVLPSMLGIGMLTLEIAQDNSPTATSLPGKVKPSTLLKERFLAAKKQY